MKRLLPLVPLLLAAAPAPAPAPQPLDVEIVWHQHQPLYPKVRGTQVYEQPWVRLHAAKDYYDMAAIVEEFPGLKLTINLTPVLLQQIDDYNHGATDRHAQLAQRDPAQLTAAEQDEARRRFFQVSPPMLKRWPRLAALKALPKAAWKPEDYRDAATLFHLAWTDPDLLAKPPLAALAAKGRGFTAADTRVILAEHRRILTQIVPLHRRLQDQGKIEVATTPYFHPILPLVIDTDAAAQALPTAPLPPRYAWPADARHHVDAAVAAYKARFGRAPAGMWPGEGSVSPAAAAMLGAAGVRWIATDEDVLARSRGVKLREGEALTAPGADLLYRPWRLAEGPAIVFRDRKLSDDIGFRYGRMAGEAAARDLLGQLERGAGGPGKERLVTLILDGENAWENYPDDGKAFLRALYRGLTTDPAFRTTTPGAYLEAHAPKPLGPLWAGSWIGASFATWIGEEEENRAWALLGAARRAIEDAKVGLPARLRALETIYAAEGSDWFWWYGADQDSGRDEGFDAAFRGLLAQVYRDLGQQPPSDLAVPIVQAGATPTHAPRAYLAPRIDGPMDRTEWAQAGAVFAEGGAMATGGKAVDALFYGWDRDRLYLAVQHADDAAGGAAGGAAGTELVVTKAGAAPSDATGVQAASGRGSTELAVAWKDLGVRSGEAIGVQVRRGGALFPAQPVKLAVPVLRAAPLVALADGPDAPAWTLPTGGAFTRESVDLQGLEVAEEGDAWAFTWKVGAIRNPWGSPVGLSLVSLDVYLAPAAGEGKPTALLDARDAKAVRPWTAAIAVEGWQAGLYGPGGTQRAEVAVAVDPFAGLVRALVPKKALPQAPTAWTYLATLAGQDGFAPGRIRQVRAEASADHFGGRAAVGSNLLDVLGPGAPAGALPYVSPAP